MAERDTVQALDHLRTRGTQTEQEPPVRQVGQRDRGLGDQDRRTGADLQDAGAEQHPIGASRDIAQRRRSVRSPGLGDPTDVETQFFRLDSKCYDLTDFLSRT